MNTLQTRTQDNQDVIYFDATKEDCGCNKLSDNTPPSEWGIVDNLFYAWGAITGADYEKAVREITIAINYNDSGFFGYAFNSSLEPKDTASVLNAYTNLNLKKLVPVFEVEKFAKVTLEQIAKKVSENSPVNYDYVYRILKQLYYYTKDGTLMSDVILRPLKYKETKEMQKLNTELNGVSAGGGANIFDKLGLPKWTGGALIGVLVLAVVGYGVSTLDKAKNLIGDGK